MALNLESVLAKIDWAQQHARTLATEVDEWRKSSPYHLTYQSNADATRYSVILNVDKPPDFRRWGLILGDAVHNVRSALDHLVFAIAMHELRDITLKLSKQLMFVIKDKPEDFKAAYWHIEKLSAPVRKAIESVQPYHRPHTLLPPLLSVLRDIDDTDKHQLLTVVLSQPTKGEFENIRNLVPGQTVRFEVSSRVVQDGSEVAAIVLDRPTRNVQFAFEISLALAVSHGAGPKGHTMTGVAELINTFLLPEVSEVIEIVRSKVV